MDFTLSTHAWARLQLAQLGQYGCILMRRLGGADQGSASAATLSLWRGAWEAGALGTLLGGHREVRPERIAETIGLRREWVVSVQFPPPLEALSSSRAADAWLAACRRAVAEYTLGQPDRALSLLAG